MESKNKMWLYTLFGLLIGGLIFGGGTYYFVNKTKEVDNKISECPKCEICKKGETLNQEETTTIPDKSYLGEWTNDRVECPDTLYIKEIDNNNIILTYGQCRVPNVSTMYEGTATLIDGIIVFSVDSGEDQLGHMVGTLTFENDTVIVKTSMSSEENDIFHR